MRFSDEFEKSKRRFNILWNVCVGFICLIFFGIISFWALGLFFGAKVLNEASNDDFVGVKYYVERVWCGKDGCDK